MKTHSHQSPHMWSGLVKHARKYFFLYDWWSNSTVIGLISVETPHPFGQDKHVRLHKQALFQRIPYRWQCFAELF